MKYEQLLSTIEDELQKINSEITNIDKSKFPKANNILATLKGTLVCLDNYPYQDKLLFIYDKLQFMCNTVSTKDQTGFLGFGGTEHPIVVRLRGVLARFPSELDDLQVIISKLSKESIDRENKAQQQRLQSRSPSSAPSSPVPASALLPPPAASAPGISLADVQKLIDESKKATSLEMQAQLARLEQERQDAIQKAAETAKQEGYEDGMTKGAQIGKQAGKQEAMQQVRAKLQEGLPMLLQFIPAERQNEFKKYIQSQLLLTGPGMDVDQESYVHPNATPAGKSNGGYVPDPTPVHSNGSAGKAEKQGFVHLTSTHKDKIKSYIGTPYSEIIDELTSLHATEQASLSLSAKIIIRAFIFSCLSHKQIGALSPKNILDSLTTEFRNNALLSEETFNKIWQNEICTKRPKLAQLLTDKAIQPKDKSETVEALKKQANTFYQFYEKANRVYLPEDSTAQDYFFSLYHHYKNQSQNPIPILAETFKSYAGLLKSAIASSSHTPAYASTGLTQPAATAAASSSNNTSGAVKTMQI